MRAHAVAGMGLVIGVLCGVAAAAQPVPFDEADGDDTGVETGRGRVPAAMAFVRVGRPPGALRRVCDLTAFGGALYMAEANAPLGSDGATLARYDPRAAVPFTLAFNWNRPGQPTSGGGGGQGFLRVRAIDGRLFVPDADPPYAGFGLVDPGTEGYVFVSDRDGRFAPPRGPRMRPPGAPDPSARPGAGVLPRAYHVLDVIAWRGQTLASTGSVGPGSRAWRGASPGALHVADADLARWRYAAGYPARAEGDVWRLGYLVRFGGRLYAGLQDYFGRESADYLRVDPPPPGEPLSAACFHPQRVTPRGGAQTLRWFAHGGRLYWVAWDRALGTVLRVSRDGLAWQTLAAPEEAGAPSDIVQFRDALVVLTEGGLYRLDDTRWTRLAAAPTARLNGRERPVFVVNDVFCAAPLAVLDDTLYAGDQRSGALWRLQEIR